MPSAKRQCSKLISGGIRLPEAKLPGRREIDKIIRKGNITSAISAITATWAARMRQRLERSTTIAMAVLYALFIRVRRMLTSEIAATRKKIRVEMAAARPKFWPESSNAMR
ncbi:hypothetical protein D9M69_723050 [compost metagenome]